MGFKERVALDSDVTVSLGGFNKKTNKANPKGIEGYYLGFREVESKNGLAKIHFFQTSKGNIGVWGKTDIDRKLAGVASGTMTRVTFDKMRAVPGKNDMYVYKVETDEDNTVAVSESAVGAAADEAAPEYSEEQYDDADADDDVDAEEPAADEPPPARTTRGATPPPSADRQKKVQELLNKARANRA